jgi:O-methyltransferase involved in polyketide biosynthesis
LNGLPKSLLITLYIRAIESQRPDALLKDESAVALVQHMDDDFAWIEQADVNEETRVAIVLRSREFDRQVRDYLKHYPQAVVVHIGCGLDARFERVDNGQVEWYDLDLPEVIDLRRGLLGGEGGRYHLLACSALDPAWFDAVSIHHPRPFLFLAEGVIMFFEDGQVRSLVLRLKEHFPGAELAFDAFSPFFVWANNRRVAQTGIGARALWGLRQGRDLEGWSDGIRLLEAWYPFSQPEPRLAHVRWVRWIPLLGKATGVFHYRLGEIVG